MVKLTFYVGVNEIGGNKILLEDSGTKTFLDFGMSFLLLDYMEFGILPDINGIYRKYYLIF